MLNPLIAFFCAVICSKLCASENPSSGSNLEASIASLRRKIVTLEGKLRSLESREMPDMQKVKDGLSARIEEVDVKSKTAHDEQEELLQSTLNFDKRLSSIKLELDGVSERLQKETDRFLVMNNYLLKKLLQVERKSDEALEKIRTLEDQVMTALEMGKLELKGNLAGIFMASHIASQLDMDEDIRKNATSVQNSTQHVDERVLSLENGTRTIKGNVSNLESLTTKLENECAEASHVSKLDERLRSIQDEVKELERRDDLRGAETSEVQETLKTHTSEISAIKAQLFEIQNICSDPPAIRNGHPLIGVGKYLNRMHGAVVTYSCDAGSTLVGSADLVCRLGQWTGVLPRCANSCRTQDLKENHGLDVPINTTVEHLKTLDVRCRRGYVMSSTSPSLTCNDGTWNFTADACIGDSCAGDPPSLQNGKAMYFERKHGSGVHYRCDKDFVISGSSTVRCKAGKWDGHPPTCGFFDPTFYAEIYEGRLLYYIECHTDSKADKIRFSRLLNTGSGTGLPDGVKLITHEKSARMDLGPTLHYDSSGAFRCGFADEGRSADVFVPYQSVRLYFLEPTVMANVGDSVTLILHVEWRSYGVLWNRHGRRVPAWDGKMEVTIDNVKTEDTGIYSARFGVEKYDRAFARLSIRRCRVDLYGERCDQACPVCYNGGICHDLLGVCVCPVGFIGSNCEIPCPEGYHGANCSIACGDEDCRNRLFCRPEDYGCSCARGYTGAECGVVCAPGWYGASCKQPCHCAGSSFSCNRITGACSAGCAPGWNGLSCQIRDVDWGAQSSGADNFLSTERSVSTL